MARIVIETEAAREPAETFLVRKATIRNTTTMPTNTRQSMARPIIAPTEIPFPPRKSWNTGKQWPRMQAPPPAAMPGSPSRVLPSHMASAALSMSPAKVAKPAPRPKTRAMLVAPALPLPCLRTSFPQPSLLKIREALIDPSR